MVEETKVPVVPIVSKTTADESLIENPREAVEKAVILENDETPHPVPDEEEEPVKEEKKEVIEDDPLERIKKSVQKRINQVVAQKKSVEEQLIEAQAEIARLKSAPIVADKKDNAPPTVEQVEAYILKMAEEGNKKEEVAATRYLIKLEKEAAIKEVEERQNKARQEAESIKTKQLNDWINLSKDYVVYDSNGKVDPKHDLNLSNQSGLLYKTALALYQDKKLHADFYNDPDIIQGFRRAVSDAYREIHQQGLTPKEGVAEILKRNPRIVLADPDATDTEENQSQSAGANLSDAEKVREEIKQRNKIRNSRKTS